MDGRFTTLDAYLGGYLQFVGHQPVAEWQNGKVVFVYAISPDLQRAIASFYSGALVPAAAFAASVKLMRGLICETRMENGNVHEARSSRRG